jgi:transposase
MPFLRVEKKKSGVYLRILESYRDTDGKSTHRILYSLGKVEDYTPDQLKRIGIKFYELGGGEIKALLEGQIEELARYNYGYVQVFSRALKYYGLDVVIKRIQRSSKVAFNLNNAIMLMLVERLHDPCSKRSNWSNQQEYLGIEPTHLQYLYRSLDKLADNNKLIQRQIFQTGRDLFNQQLDVVFYDVTTLYFESEEEQEGSLRQKGFSKDGKIGNTQILFCMLIDQNKSPIGYRIFKGDTFEGHTFEKALEDLKNEFQIDKIVVVADRGMLSKNNITLVSDRGYEFIIGERIKTLPQSIQKPLLDKSNYKQEWIYTDNEDEKITVKYTSLTHEGKTIIATYSEKRAKKDKADREKKLQTAQTLLKQPGLLKKKASRYYLTATNDHQYTLNNEKIKADEAYDGILAIATNNSTLSHSVILEQYKQLYKIEHTFRTFKSHLEMRPMFHWTDKRIEGHICLCYIAYTLLNFVQQKLIAAKNPISENKLRNILDHMQVSLIQHNTDQVYIRSRPQDEQGILQQKLGIQLLPPIIPKSQISSYL